MESKRRALWLAFCAHKSSYRGREIDWASMFQKNRLVAEKPIDSGRYLTRAGRS
jgi:hypothetical protein